MRRNCTEWQVGAPAKTRARCAGLLPQTKAPEYCREQHNYSSSTEVPLGGTRGTTSYFVRSEYTQKAAKAYRN